MLVEKTLKEGMKNVEKNIPLQLLLTDYYVECLEYEMSEKNALEVLEKDNKNLGAYERLLYIYDQQGEFEKLEATYKKYDSKIENNKGKLFLAKAYLRQYNKIEATKLFKSLDQEKVGKEPLFHVVNLGINNEEQLDFIQSQTGDINGDGKEENICLLAYDSADGYSDVINIVIQNANDGTIIETILLSDYMTMGNPSKIELVDANHDKVLDILVSIDSGGSAGEIFHQLFSYKDNKLINYLDTSLYDVRSSFIDDYKAEVISHEAKKSYVAEFDKERKERYYEAGYYSKDRKLSDNSNLAGISESTIEPFLFKN